MSSLKYISFVNTIPSKSIIKYLLSRSNNKRLTGLIIIKKHGLKIQRTNCMGFVFVFQGYEGSLLKVTSKNGKTASVRVNNENMLLLRVLCANCKTTPEPQTRHLMQVLIKYCSFPSFAAGGFRYVPDARWRRSR